MKNKWFVLGLAATMMIGNIGVYANEPVGIVPINALIPVETDMVSIHQIDYAIPISLAELMIIAVKVGGETLPLMMDTHYAMPAMQKTAEWGIINLEEHPMDTWLTPLTEEEFNGMLTKIMQSGKVDMGEMYTALNAILVKDITVDGKTVDLEGRIPTHYEGHLMVPVRVIAEAMGFKVVWDNQTSTVTLTNGQIQSPIQLGYDNYFYSSTKAIGMTTPIQLGVTPKLVEGKVYVPYTYFDLFATSTIQGGVLDYKMNTLTKK